MATIPIVKPDGPMTITAVDERLAACASALRQSVRIHATEERIMFRERVVMDADRLLDVRLAIDKAEA